MSQLDSLQNMTVIVADTGDLDAVAVHRPQDATTNPSLLLQASRKAEYRHHVEEAIGWSKSQPGDSAARTEALLDRLSVNFGRAILDLIPGRVSTEVDARLSFDIEGTVSKARRLIELYEAAKVDRERVLIKVAATWEGIRAAARLEKDGIHCNLTLLFSFAQAVACAEAGVTLISPFVGRIYDWYRKDRGVDDIPIAEDPGVESVTRIYHYFKKFDYATQVMGANFRKADQIVELAGCDLLTISPDLLSELAGRPGEVERKLSVEAAKASEIERLDLDEKTFRWLHNGDAMAVEKLADGIRRFDADARKLEAHTASLVAAA